MLIPLTHDTYLYRYDVSNVLCTGECEDSMAIRVGDYKLIVGQFARCGRNPNRAGEDEDFITQRMCGWWLPVGSANNTQRAEEIDEAYALNENASRHGSALDAIDREQHTQHAMTTAAPAPPPHPTLPVMLFNIALDPNGPQQPTDSLPTQIIPC
jgi:hypothetical protein|eukprot:COSAG02_NODE_4151_length_5709_cov_21.395187_3_plen_155_part_00